jgi:hypothetical protein
MHHASPLLHWVPRWALRRIRRSTYIFRTIGSISTVILRHESRGPKRGPGGSGKGMARQAPKVALPESEEEIKRCQPILHLRPALRTVAGRFWPPQW